MHLFVDVGATWVRVDDSESSELPLVERTAGVGPEVVEQIATLALRRTGSRRLTGMAVGCPGLVDEAGCVTALFLGWPPAFGLQSALQSILGIKVRVVNDVFAQGHGLRGRAPRRSVLLSAGSAVGGAVHTPRSHTSAEYVLPIEIGHVFATCGGAVCACGSVGCLETIVGGLALATRLGDEWWLEPERGDVRAALELAGEAIGHACRSAARLLDTDLFVLCGQIFRHQLVIDHARRVAAPWFGTVQLEVVPNSWTLAAPGLRYLASC